jgi:hypothetical protein
MIKLGKVSVETKSAKPQIQTPDFGRGLPV